MYNFFCLQLQIQKFIELSRVYFIDIQILLLSILNSTEIRERVNPVGFDLCVEIKVIPNIRTFRKSVLILSRMTSRMKENCVRVRK